MPDVFEFIISIQTSCAPGHLKTVKSLVLVRNFDNNMDRHLGRDGHSYCHWLWLDIAPGVYKLWTLCRDFPAAGHPVARDEAPLRLVSWLSFRLTKRCHAFIQTAMDSLCSTQNADLLAEVFFFARRLQRISRILAVLNYKRESLRKKDIQSCVANRALPK